MAEYENIILLTLDALRADHLSSYGYERETSPFLDQLAEENTVFRNFYSVSSHTREAVPSMLTGKYPDEAIASNYNLEARSLAEDLENTAAFHSNPFISRAYDYEQGFEKFYDDLNLGRNKILTIIDRMIQKLTNRHYARAPKINSKSLDWISGREGFFLWNHYMDTHGPYEPPAEYQELFRDETLGSRRSQLILQKAIKTPGRLSDDEHQALVDLYDAEIRYADDRLRAFVEELEARGLTENSLVIITADHGEAFGEDGFYEHPRNLSKGLLHIPLIIMGPGIPDREVEAPATLRDVYSTVLSAAGVENDGVNLLDYLDNEDSYRKRTVYAQVRKKHSKVRRFYAKNLEAEGLAEGDPENGVTHHEGGIDSLREHAEQRLRNHEPGASEEEEKEEEVKQKLEALGYLQEKSD